MRPVLYGDLHAAARRLASLAETAHGPVIREMLYRAHCADRLRKRTGRGHPDWGNGSLVMAARSGWPSPDGAPTEAQYLRALASVACGILRWRAERGGDRSGAAVAQRDVAAQVFP